MTDQLTPPLSRPTTADPAAWRAYWASQNMLWRTEPEISPERQAYLAERRAIQPDIEQGIYPFKGVEPKLTRADIEWLLGTHDDGHGPVIRNPVRSLAIPRSSPAWPDVAAARPKARRHAPGAVPAARWLAPTTTTAPHVVSHPPTTHRTACRRSRTAP